MNAHDRTGLRFSLPSLNVLGLRLIDATRAQTIDHIVERIKARSFLRVNFVNANNANFAASDPEYRQTLANSLNLPDGIGMDIAARVLVGQKFSQDLNGTDLTPQLIGQLNPGARIAFIGAKPGIANAAADMVKHFAPHVEISLCVHGYLDPALFHSTAQKLRDEPVDLVLVAMGTPIQELWAAKHLDNRHTVCVMCVGALFDFLSGRVERAPLWVRRIRCEWVYRLLQEPKRLWKRYIIGNAVFLGRVFFYKLTGKG